MGLGDGRCELLADTLADIVLLGVRVVLDDPEALEVPLPVPLARCDGDTDGDDVRDADSDAVMLWEGDWDGVIECEGDCDGVSDEDGVCEKLCEGDCELVIDCEREAVTLCVWLRDSLCVGVSDSDAEMLGDWLWVRDVLGDSLAVTV